MENGEKRRVYGLEVEYGSIFAGGETMLPDVVPRRVRNNFFDNLHRICRIDHCGTPSTDWEDNEVWDFFTRNGGRIYLDVGDHPETATPECRTLRDTVLYDKASERIFESALRETREFLARDDPLMKEGELLLFRNNSGQADEVDITFGCHENYLFRLPGNFQPVMAGKLTPFLLTRQIFCGAGKIWENRYEISQRARFLPRLGIWGMKRSIGLDSNGRIDVQTLVENRVWRRLHLILGDSNMSEYSAWLKLGVTALVLRMIEDGFLEFAVGLQIPWEKFSRSVSQDLTCRRKLPVIFREAFDDPGSAEELSPVEIQELYLTAAKKYLRMCQSELPAQNLAEFQALANEWEAVLEKLKSDPMLLKNEVDWVMKKNLLDEYRRHRRVWWTAPDLKMIDLQYHNIDRTRGLYYLLENEGLARRILDEPGIEAARLQPPADTRANWRSSLIRYAETRQLSYWPNWEEFYFLMPAGRNWIKAYECTDPFHSEPEDL